MHFDSLSTMAGRHLAYAYAVVVLVQAGYAGWVVRRWMKLSGEQKKATKPAV